LHGDKQEAQLLAKSLPSRYIRHLCKSLLFYWCCDECRSHLKRYLYVAMLLNQNSLWEKRNRYVLLYHFRTGRGIVSPALYVCHSLGMKRT
jgi:hypothetical protein